MPVRLRVAAFLLWCLPGSEATLVSTAPANLLFPETWGACPRAHLVTPTTNLLPLPARNERGEGWGRGGSHREMGRPPPRPPPPRGGRGGGGEGGGRGVSHREMGLLSPALSSRWGGEGVDVLLPA